LIDLGLPVMDGYELATHLRLIPGLERLRVLALTGYGQQIDRRRTSEAGFTRHLIKPISHEELLHAIREVITEQQTELEAE